METLLFCNPPKEADDIDNIYIKFERGYLNIPAIVEITTKYISEYEFNLTLNIASSTREYDGVIEIIIGEIFTKIETRLRLTNIYGRVNMIATTPFILKKTESDTLGGIPKIIHQSYKHNLYINNLKACQSWKLLNPNFEYKFWNDLDCRNLIKTHFSKDTLSVYDRLYAGAFKADVFRLCVLYLYGGVWVDVSTVCESPLSALLYNNNDLSLLIPYDRPAQEHDFIGNIWQAFVGCPKESPIIKFILDFTVSRLLKEDEYEKRYPWLKRLTTHHGALGVTGPTVFGTALNLFLNRNPAEVFEESIIEGIKIVTFYSGIVSYCGKTLLKSKYEGFEKDRYNFHYSQYFNHGFILKKVLENRKISDTAMNIYQIWIQSNLVSNNLYENALSWSNAYSDFNYTLVTDTDILAMLRDDNEFPMLYKCYVKVSSYSHKSDLIRAYIIYKYGGLYADLQSQCINKYKGDIQKLHICVFFNTYTNELTSSVFYCFRSSKFLKHYLLLMCSQITESNIWVPDKMLMQKTLLSYFGLGGIEEGVYHKNDESLKIIPYTSSLPIPKGSWITSSRNYVVRRGNILEAEVLNINEEWVHNEVQFSAGDLLCNDNGKLKGNTISNANDTPVDLFKLSYNDFKNEARHLS